MIPQPTYTPSNCNSAFQLNWALTVFSKQGMPFAAPIIDALNEAVANDLLRILEYRLLETGSAQFFISSRPQHSPASIIRSIKGRWQHIARQSNQQIEFRRNYDIHSIGSARREVLDKYVARQNEKHPMADSALQSALESLQFVNSEVKPEAVRKSAYGRYAYALHVVIESECGWNEYRPDVLLANRNMIIGTCRKYEWPLSRIGLLSNHLHILLSPGVQDSPENVAFALMNNMAYAQGNKPVFRYSYYVGTFGAFDRGAIWNNLEKNNLRQA